MSSLYILDELRRPKQANSLEWARWFETSDRVVAQTIMPDGTRVSTVFVGINYRFGEGEPLLWETLVFGGKHNNLLHRYASEEDARRNHERIVAMIAEDA